MNTDNSLTKVKFHAGEGDRVMEALNLILYQPNLSYSFHCLFHLLFKFIGILCISKKKVEFHIFVSCKGSWLLTVNAVNLLTKVKFHVDKRCRKIEDTWILPISSVPFDLGSRAKLIKRVDFHCQRKISNCQRKISNWSSNASFQIFTG